MEQRDLDEYKQKVDDVFNKLREHYSPVAISAALKCSTQTIYNLNHTSRAYFLLAAINMLKAVGVKVKV
jgi:hypothetical protein